MTEETFHFEITTDEISEQDQREVEAAKEVMSELCRAVGIRPGTATVTLGSEKDKGQAD